MFSFLFFICPFVFLIQAIIFPLCISKNIPSWLYVNIGGLNANDIRRLNPSQRAYFKRQVIFRFITAVLTTLIIGILFIILGCKDKPLYAVFCNSIGLIVGLSIVLSITKAASKIKKDLE